LLELGVKAVKVPYRKVCALSSLVGPGSAPVQAQ